MTIITGVVVVIIVFEFAPFVRTYCDCLIFIQACVIKARDKATAFKFK